MNAAHAWQADLVFFLPLAAGTIIAVGLAALLCKCLRAAVWQRAVWRVCILTLAVLFMGEATGLTRVVGVRPRAFQSADDPSDGRSGHEWTRLDPALADDRLTTAGAFADPLSESEDTLAADLPSERETTQEVASSLGPWIITGWLIGVAVLVGRVAVGRILLAVLRRRQRPVEDAQLLERVLELARRLGIRRRVHLQESAGLTGPVAFGVLRPTIALPLGFASKFDPRHQEVMLAHELAHLAGHDPAWHLLADLIAAALWWHPLAWWARHRLRHSSEAAADEASLLVHDGPGVLASCLVELGARLARPRAISWLRMAGPGFRSNLGQRVDRLLRLGGGPWRPPSRLRLLLVFLIGPPVLLGAAVASTAWARPATFHEGDSPMFHWKRSLAAVVMASALGAGDAAVAEPADEPVRNQAGGDPSQSAKPDKPAEETTEELQSIQKRLRVLQDQIDGLRQRAQEMDQQRKELQSQAGRGADDPTVKLYLSRLQAANKEIDQVEQEKAKLNAQAEALQAKRIKVFRLTHRSPEEVQVVVQSLLGRTRWSGRMLGAGGARGALGGAFPGGATPNLPQAGGVPMGGGFSNTRSFPGTRVAADNRTNSLIVQGSERDLQLAADVIAVLDLPAEKGVPKVKSFTAIRLKNADANNLVAVLSELDLDVRIAAVGNDLLIVTGPESAVKELGEVIKELDVEGKDRRKRENLRPSN